MKMASGLCAAVGAYRTAILCMICVVIWGLHTGWIQTLCAGEAPGLWVARVAAMWAVLFVAFLPTAQDAVNRTAMGFCMLVFSMLLCLVAFSIVQLAM